MTILALLADDNKTNRQKGFSFIQKYRDNKNPDDDTIRSFRKYKEDEVNLLCNDYTNFIQYDKVEITEAPATFHISLEELEDIVDGKGNSDAFGSFGQDPCRHLNVGNPFFCRDRGIGMDFGLGGQKK